MSQHVRLYSSRVSGNCYKARLLFAQLDIAHDIVEIDVVAGGARTAEFRNKFPLGRVPALEVTDGTTTHRLAESNAILCLFAEGTPLLPSPHERWARAEVMQWLFWEQYSHEPYVAVARAWLRYFGVPEGRRDELYRIQERGRGALSTMERHLETRRFFVDERYTIADIALYAYTHVAEEGELSLAPFPAVRAWLGRVESTPGFEPMLTSATKPRR